MAVANICQFYQNGYGKYRNLCRNQHVTEVCEVQNCNIIECIKRYPRKCRFFHELNRCKFKKYCLYSHNQTTNYESEKTNLEKDLGVYVDEDLIIKNT